MSRAKPSREEQAAPPTAADARLQQMRRRVHLGRLGVWGAVAAGPIALAVAVATPATVVQAAPEEKPDTVQTAVAASPAGYATVFLDAWLRSHAGGETSAQARLAQSMGPGIALPDVPGAQPAPESVVAVRSTQQTGDAPLDELRARGRPCPGPPGWLAAGTPRWPSAFRPRTPPAHHWPGLLRGEHDRDRARAITGMETGRPMVPCAVRTERSRAQADETARLYRTLMESRTGRS
ncbi:hypothetical protein [Streptomyces pseudovenezuelae]|uniref:Uncharacterized protein n=1 Tax=Streptomyces pseudovenezuelae TaxID=67350 RepID=A0ABT6M2X0_9ACTN|nr:hypothetical protein [Streptomyces pseudovenezuelae]MDH6222882.1 hypothetical protein [Streptomyces pseudovenezuelae]